MHDKIEFISYHPRFDDELAQLDSLCENVRVRKSWIKRHMLGTYNPKGATIALIDGKIVGAAMMRIDTYCYQQRNWKLGYLSDVAVHPQHQKKGIGSMLSVRSLDFAQKKDADGVILFTTQDNIPAYSLYKKLGFFDIAYQDTLQWNQQDINMPLTFSIRPAQARDKKRVVSLIEKTFNNYELFAFQQKMIFNCRHNVWKPGVSTYIFEDKNMFIGCCNTLNYGDIWEYRIPGGTTPPILIYNFAVAEKDKKEIICRTFLKYLRSSIQEYSKLIVTMIDAKASSELSLYEHSGFARLIRGVWMGKAFNKELVFNLTNQCIYGGFSI